MLEGYETTAEVAKRLQVQDSRIRHLIRDGRLEGAIKIGTMWFIPAGAEPSEGARGPEPNYAKD